jgi:hypothetical protein
MGFSLQCASFSSLLSILTFTPFSRFSCSFPIPLSPSSWSLLDFYLLSFPLLLLSLPYLPSRLLFLSFFHFLPYQLFLLSLYFLSLLLIFPYFYNCITFCKYEYSVYYIIFTDEYACDVIWHIWLHIWQGPLAEAQFYSSLGLQILQNKRMDFPQISANKNFYKMEEFRKLFIFRFDLNCKGIVHQSY